MPIRNALRESSYTTDLMLDEVLAIPACERRHEAGPMDGDTTHIASASARLPADDRGSGIADGDWDDLFNAVQDQLTHLVSDGAFGSATSIAPGAAQIRDGVLDCVAALRLLQETVDARRVQRDGRRSSVHSAVGAGRVTTHCTIILPGCPIVNSFAIVSTGSWPRLARRGACWR